MATALITPKPFSYNLDLRIIGHSIPRITSFRYSNYTLNNLWDKIKIPRYHSSMNYQQDTADIATALITPTHFSYTLDLQFILHSIARITQIRYSYYKLNKLQDKIKIPRSYSSMNYQQDTADIATALITPTPFSYTLDLRFIMHSIARITQIRYSYYTLNYLWDKIKIPRYHSSMNYQQDTADIATALNTPTRFSYTLDLPIIGHSIPRITSIRYSYCTLNKLQDKINIPRYHSSMGYQQDTADIVIVLITPTFFSHTLDIRFIGHSIPRITSIRYSYYTLHNLQDKIKKTPYHSSTNN